MYDPFLGDGRLENFRVLDGAEFGSDFGDDRSIHDAIIAYRMTWDPFVTGVIRQLGNLGDVLVSESTRSDIPAGFSAASLKAEGDSFHQKADSYLKLWNLYSGLPQDHWTPQSRAIFKTWSNLVSSLRQEVGEVKSGKLSVLLSGIAKFPSEPSSDRAGKVYQDFDAVAVDTNSPFDLTGWAFKKTAEDTAKGIGQAVGGAAGAAVSGAGEGVWKEAFSKIPWWGWGLIAVAGGGVLMGVISPEVGLLTAVLSRRTPVKSRT